MPEYKTLMDFTPEQIKERLTAKLEDAAYKALDNAWGGTDIGPAYCWETLTDVFGPVGIGWWFEPGELLIDHVKLHKADGSGTYDRWDARYDQFALYYRLFTESGHIDSRPIFSNGQNLNDDYGYAVRGAMTNAIGAAAKFLLWQLSIYKGQGNNAGGRGEKDPLDEIVRWSHKEEKLTGRQWYEQYPEDVIWWAANANSSSIKEFANSVLEALHKPDDPEPSQQGTQTVPANNPGLYTVLTGEHAKKTLLQINKESPTYISKFMLLKGNAEWKEAARLFLVDIGAQLGPMPSAELLKELEDRIVMQVGSTDVTATLAKRNLPPLAKMSVEQVQQAVEKLRAAHWSKTDDKRKAFWAKANELGIENKAAHIAINKERLVDYLGTLTQAIEVLELYAKDAPLPEYVEEDNIPF